MFYLYLYDNLRCNHTSNTYGYYTGKSYTVQGLAYPVIYNGTNGFSRKEYTSLRRAITGGIAAKEKYGYVLTFDIEDEKGNIVYESNQRVNTNLQQKNLSERDRTNNLNTITNSVSVKSKKIQVAIKHIEEVPYNLTDIEIENYLKNKYPNTEFMWSDNSIDIFETY